MEYREIKNNIHDMNINDVIYANGKWIFSGTNANWNLALYTSSDLKTFEKIDIKNWNINITRASISYGNGLYYLIVDSEHVFVSSDLVNWTDKISSIQKLEPYTQFINNIWFENGQFILTVTKIDELQYHHYIYTSYNLENWTFQTKITNSDIGYSKIVFYNNNYYLSSIYGKIYKSADLKSWQLLRNVEDNVEDVYLISGSKGILAVISEFEDVAHPKIATIKNDKFEIIKTIDGWYYNMVYGNGVYFVRTSNGILYSLDLIDFFVLTQETISSVDRVSGIFYSQEKQMFLMVGTDYVRDENYLNAIDVSRELFSKKIDEEMIYIYNLDFEFVGIIDSFKSLRWRRKYFEAGEFEIVVPYDENTLDYFEKNRLVIRDNYTESGIIETIKKEDNGTDEDITLSGRFLSSILDRRIVKSIVNFKGSTIDGMKVLLNQMTPFPNFEIEKTNFNNEQVEFQCSYKNVYDYLIKLSKYSNVGFRIVPNLENKVFIFETYQGKNRTWQQEDNERYSFSDYESNINTSTLTTSNTSKVNYALVGGQGEGTERVLVETKNGNFSGFDLYETFVDSRSSSQDELTLQEYKDSLVLEGKNAFSDDIYNFEFSVDSTDYKDKYDLGDIINIAKNRWGYSTIARIIEVEEVIEDGVKTVTLVTGAPLPEKLTDD